MTEDLLAFDEAYQKKKKTIIVIATILIALLGVTLLVSQAGREETPTPTAIAAVTTASAATDTPLVRPSLSPTVAPQMATSTPTMPPPTQAFTATPTVTPTQSPWPTVITVTAQPPTDTPSPTLTSSPTPTPSPTAAPPTLTPTATPPPAIVPVIESPLDGSELPGEALSVSGSGGPGATIQLFEGDSYLGQAVADPNGRWVILPVIELAAGEHTIVAVDAATGAMSTPVSFSLVKAILPITGDGG